MPRARYLWIIKAGVTLALLVWLAHKLEWSTLWARMSQARPELYLLAVGLLALPIFLSTARWKVTLRAQDVALPFRFLMAIDMAALFFNAFLPGAVGGDAARAYYAVRRAEGHGTRIISSIVFDRAIGLLVLLMLGYMALLGQEALFQRVPALRWFASILPWVVLLGLVALVLLFALPSRALGPRLRGLLQRVQQLPVIGELHMFVKKQRARPRSLLAIVALTLAAYVFNFASAWMVALAMNLSITYVQVVLMLAVLLPVVALPISVAGHGLREVVLVGLFATLGVGSAEDAVAFSLLMVSVTWCWSLAGGVWFLYWRDQLRAAQEADAINRT